MSYEKILKLRFKVILGEIKPWWWRVAYLIPDIFNRHPEVGESFTKLIEGDKNVFGKFVKGHVTAYLDKGTLPPAAIVGPILNIAEDIMAGRDPVIRAGDYIAIQNQMRGV